MQGEPAGANISGGSNKKLAGIPPNQIIFRGLKGPLSPGREKRGGTDSDRDSELELDYAQCKYYSMTETI